MKELYAHYILNPVKSREQIQTLALPTTVDAQVLRSSATLDTSRGATVNRALHQIRVPGPQNIASNFNHHFTILEKSKYPPERRKITVQLPFLL